MSATVEIRYATRASWRSGVNGWTCTALLGILLVTRGAAGGVTNTWNSTSSADFNNMANWSGGGNFGGPGLTDVARFPSHGSLVDPVLTADAYVYGWDITASNWIFGTLPSSYKLHMGPGGITGVKEATADKKRFNLSIDADQTWDVTTAGNAALHIEGSLFGTGRITKTGSGDLYLWGNGNNFSGGITVLAGGLFAATNSTATNALGTGVVKFGGGGTLASPAKGTGEIATPFEFATPAQVSFSGNPCAYTGPWSLSRMLNHTMALNSGTWTASGPISGQGGLWNSGGTYQLSLSGTGKTFTGPIYGGGRAAAALDINAAITPKAVYVRLSQGSTVPLAAPLQVSATGTLGSGPIEVQAGGLIVKAASGVSGNSTILIKRSPLFMGFLSIQYNGALPGNLDTVNSTGFIALDTAYTNGLSALGHLYLGATAANTFSGPSWAVGYGNTYRLGGGDATLTLDAAATTAGVLTGSSNSVSVGVPAARLADVSRSPGVNGGAVLVTLKDDNDFGGSLTVNNYSSLLAQKPATATATSPLGANGTDKAVTLNGADLRLDNTTAGTNGLAVSKGVLTLSSRNMLTVLGSATKTATLTFDSLAWDTTWGGALILNNGDAKSSLGNYGKIKVTSLATTNLASPRILLATNASFVAYDTANGFSGVIYADKSADFTPAEGEIARTRSGLAMAGGTLQALTLAGGTVTNNGTVNIASGALSVDTAAARAITNGTIHFGPSGDSTVEGFIGLAGSAENDLTLGTALDGGAGVTFCSHYGNGQGEFRAAGIARVTSGRVWLDTLPVSQLDGKLKLLSHTTIGFRTGGTTDFGAIFPNLDALVFNGGRFTLSSSSRTVTIPQNIEIGPNGCLFTTDDNNYSATLVLNGNLSGSGPLVIDGGGNSASTAINGTNSAFSGDVTIGGGSHTVAAASSLGTGNVLVKIGSGGVASRLYLLGASNIASNRRLSFDSDPTSLNNATVYFRSSSPAIGSLEGCGGRVAITNSLTVGGDNSDTVYGGLLLNDGSAKGAFTKAGSGTMTLMGVNTHTGPTTVNNGTLLVDGSLTTGSAVTVQSGATLGGFGDVFGAVTNKAGSVLKPGHDAIGTLTLGSLVQEAGVTNVFEVDGLNTSDMVVVTSNLTFDANAVVKVSPLANSGSGTYTLFRYGGTLSNLPSLVSPVGGKLVATSNTVQLVLGSAGTILSVQ